MEWREQPTLSCEMAFTEGQRWVEELTGKPFGSNNFRSALENGVLLCDLINKLKPGIIKRVNRLSTPIAGLDNVNVFLKACGKLGLNEAQLFDPGDLQDVSTRVTVRHKETSRRLKNVLITIYWLGRKAQSDQSYSGPQLNFKAFEGLLGAALSKALEDVPCTKSNVRDGGFGESWFSNRTERCYKREDSSESLDSVDSHTQSLVSDSTLVAGSEGFDSDAEAEHCFRMSDCNRKEASVATRDRRHVPAPLRRKRSGQHEDERGRANPILRTPLKSFHCVGSKSMGDIPLEPMPQSPKRSLAFGSLGSSKDHQGKVFLNPSAMNRVNLEQLQHIKARLKESEARWQEDLNRWKSRRRSTNSELHKKKEEREQLELVINKIALQQKSEQEEFPVFIAPQQQQNKAHVPSFIQMPSSNAHTPFQPYVQREESHLGQLKSEEAFAPSAASSFTSSYSMPAPISSSSQSVSVLSGISLSGGCSNINSGNAQYTQPIVTYQGQEVAAGLVDEPGTTDDLASLSTLQPDSGSAPGHTAPVLVPRASSLKGASSGTTQMSASLPRGFRRSEGTSRLFTGVTPRPFGSKLTRMSSLPKFCLMSDSTNISNTQQTQLPASCPAMNITEEKTRFSSHPAVHWNKVEEEKHVTPSAPIVHSFMSASVLTAPSKHSNPHTVMTESDEDKLDHDDFRVSLNQKPSSKGDFGFQAYWDSTGARIRSIHPGSPAQLCHLQVGDEIVVLGGRRVADMSYEQWKTNMDAALQEGKLLMDICRKILNGHSDQCNTITNTSSAPTDEVAKVPVNNHPANGLPVKEEIRRACDGSIPSKGGSESAISDIQVPSISASSSRWSWDTKEERRKQEKWQMEQERLLQEKYQRDQERMEEEWRRAQQEVAQVDYSNFEKLEVCSLSNGKTKPSMPPTPPSPPCQAVSSAFGASCPSAVDSEPVQNRQVQMSTSHQPKERCDPIMMSSQWSTESSGFAKLTAMDRKKSKSTPSLDGSPCGTKRVGIKNKGRLSQAAQDRQLILNEMKKKTPLLTDSSWIRQQISGATEKEPVRRYESLDNLHISSNPSKPLPSSSQTTLTHSTSLCAGPYRGYSGRCSLGPNAAIFSSSLRPSSWSRPISGSLIETVPCVQNSPSSQQQSRLVSRRRQCYRCKQSLGKGLAIVIESLDISFHLKCFKCVSCRNELEGGSEFGPQVRVRHRQLLCDTCYSRFRVQPGTPK